MWLFFSCFSFVHKKERRAGQKPHSPFPGLYYFMMLNLRVPIMSTPELLNLNLAM